MIIGICDKSRVYRITILLFYWIKKTLSSSKTQRFVCQLLLSMRCIRMSGRPNTFPSVLDMHACVRKERKERASECQPLAYNVRINWGEGDAISTTMATPYSIAVTLVKNQYFELLNFI